MRAAVISLLLAASWHANSFIVPPARSSSVLDRGVATPAPLRMDAIGNLEAFFEKSSREGRDFIKTLDVEERTKLAMKAEELEDQIVEKVESLSVGSGVADAEGLFTAQVDIKQMLEEYRYVVGATRDNSSQ